MFIYIINSVSLVGKSNNNTSFMKNNPKKQQIIKAAQKRFVRHGLSKTTVEEIARDLRIGKATVYHYFTSKEEIFYEVLQGEIDYYIESITTIFLNGDNNLNTKLHEYIKLKTSLREGFPLLNELLFLIINGKAIAKELEIFRSLVDKEVRVIAGTLKELVKMKSDSYIPQSLVLQSFSYMLSSEMSKAAFGTEITSIFFLNEIMSAEGGD